jgi:hypothetical protein
MQPTEYEMMELALQRVQGLEQSEQRAQSEPSLRIPTDGQYVMAAAMPLLLFFSSVTLLIYAGIVKGTTSEKTSPVLSTCISISMLIFEGVCILYKHHEQYMMIPSIMEIMARVQIFHLIICGSFVPYVNTTNDYGTYYTWIHVLTLPLILLSIFPFLVGVFRLE